MSYSITENCTSCGACIQWCPTDAIIGRRKSRVYIAEASCVSCGACGKVCGHHAILNDLGEYQEKVRILSWPKPSWDYQECTLCGSCVDVCPAKCVKMDTSIKKDDTLPGFPSLTRPKLCLGCGFCVQECPTNSIQLIYPVL